MAITQVEDGEERPIETKQSLLSVEQKLVGYGVPSEAFMRAMVDRPAYADLCYRTDVCTLELLLAEYIGSLIPSAESFSPGEQPTSGDLDQVIYTLRLLRETVVSCISAYIYSPPPSNLNSFFAPPPMPQVAVTQESGFEAAYVMPLREYLQHLFERHNEIKCDPMLMDIAAYLFRVGISARPEDGGKHFILLPDPKELLQAARDGKMLHTESNY